MRRTALAAVLLLAAAGPGIPAADAQINTCKGKTATLMPTNDFQTLVGTDGDDVILAGGYSITRIEALGGNDLICAGPGRTEILPGPGDDEVYAGSRDDVVYESTGDDVLVGGGGVDTLSYQVAQGDYGPGSTPQGVVLDAADGTATGFGADTFSGFESYAGTDASDRFTGSSAPETYFGGQGPDDVFGGEGDDVLFSVLGLVSGGPGNDTLRVVNGGYAQGGLGDDHIVVSIDHEDYSGLDSFHVHAGPGNDLVQPRNAVGQGGNEDIPWTGEVVGGPGRDTVDLTGVDYRARVDLREERLTWPTGDTSLSRFENVVGTRHGDRIAGTDGANRIEGRGGDDVVFGRDGPDVLLGGPRTDTTYGGSGRDVCRAETRYNCELRHR